jgi:hypothetical protein
VVLDTKITTRCLKTKHINTFAISKILGQVYLQNEILQIRKKFKKQKYTQKKTETLSTKDNSQFIK